MHRLVCAFVVPKPGREVFSHRSPYGNYNVLHPNDIFLVVYFFLEYLCLVLVLRYSVLCLLNDCDNRFAEKELVLTCLRLWVVYMSWFTWSQKLV